MLPTNFSFHETYSKHRNPEEMRAMEKRDREALIRNYQVGDPVNNPDSAEAATPRKRRESLLTYFSRFVTAIHHTLNFIFSNFQPRPH